MYQTKKFFMIAIVSLLIFPACSGKNSKKALDPGPSFSLDSSEGAFIESVPKEIAMHRDDPDFGPQIELQIHDKASIVSSEKKIISST